MKPTVSDAMLREAVIRELDSDPDVGAKHISVTAIDGAVTLRGHVATYHEKHGAVRAAERVPAVRAVADDIEVGPLSAHARADDEIAEEIARRRGRRAESPESVAVQVRDGRVVLHGEVESAAQRDAAERAAHELTGVRGVTNLIEIKTETPPNCADVGRLVHDAPAHVADLDSRSIGTKPAGEVEIELAPVADAASGDALGRHLDTILYRTCKIARALTGAEQAALNLDVGEDPAQARKYFSLSEKYASWRDFRVDPEGIGLHGMAIPPGAVVRLTQEEVLEHPLWRNFGSIANEHPPMRGWLATSVCGAGGHRYGLLQLSDKKEGRDFDNGDAELIRELAALIGEALDWLRVDAARPAEATTPVSVRFGRKLSKMARRTQLALRRPRHALSA